MQALIFNSGVGLRLGKLTSHNPKGMVRLLDSGESIFERQLRILYSCGIHDFVVTTGPWEEQLQEAAKPYEAKNCSFTFVKNPMYNETNYIYSLYLAGKYLYDDEFLMLHGDLVFDEPYARKLIRSNTSSAGSVNPTLPLPKKDFKARIVNGEVREVSVDIFDDDCVAFQAFYKLSAPSLQNWLKAVDRFCAKGITNVYAEDAANEIFGEMHVAALSYEGHCVEEIDTPDDLIRVSKRIAEIDEKERIAQQ